MRSFLLAVALPLIATSACTDAPAEAKDPPGLRVISPERGTIKDGLAPVQVTGIVTPNAESGEPIEKVTVNGVLAELRADGSFSATLQLEPGATMIHTEAKDAAGAIAEDTRTIAAGELRPVGTAVESGLAVNVSKQAFAKMATVAGPMIKGMDFAPMLADMNPMARYSDEEGPDCNYAQAFVDDVNMQDVKITMEPTLLGLQFSAEVTGLQIPGSARWSVLCADGSTTMNITADKVTVSGRLVVTPDGNGGFATTLENEVVNVQNMNIDATGFTGTVINWLSLDKLAGWAVSKMAPKAMEPMLNDALGGMAGPQQLELLGKQVTFGVDPTEVNIDPLGAQIALSTNVMVAGAENSPGYIFTVNGPPVMNAGEGLAIGLADDLANQLLAEAKAIGLLNLGLHAEGGSFDHTQMEMTLPPMLSADPRDGKMKVILGDVITTYSNHGTPVARAALNATIDLVIEPSANGYGVMVKLGEPTAHVTVLDDIENNSRLTDDKLAAATEGCLGAQITAISQLLSNIPMPSLMGVQMRDVSMSSNDGYVMLKASID